MQQKSGKNLKRRKHSSSSHGVLRLVGMRRFMMGFIALLIILAPLPVGASARWAWGLIGIAVVGLLGIWSAWCFARREVSFWRTCFLWIIPVIALVAAGQIFTGAGFLGLSPKTVEVWDAAEALGLPGLARTVSLYPQATRDTLALGLIAAAFFLLCISIFRDRRHVYLLVASIGGSALVNALYGMAQQFQNNRYIFTYYRTAHLNAVVGTFANKNHFALLLEIGIPVLLGWALAAYYASHTRDMHDADPARHFARARADFIYIACGLSLVVMLVALLFSLSRTGTVSALLMVLVLSGLALRESGRKLALVGIFALLGAALYIGSARGLENVWVSLEDVASGDSLSGLGRLDLWKSSLALLQDYSLAGVGLGAHHYVSPHYESGFSPSHIGWHAHNDWLEILCEMGVPAGGAFIALLAFGLAVLAWRIIRRRDPIAKWIGLGALCSLVAVSFHEFFDYGLRNPGNQIVCLATLALAVICSRMPGMDEDPDARDRRKINISGIQRYVFLGVIAAICFFSLNWLVPGTIAGFSLGTLEQNVRASNNTELASVEDMALRRIELSRETLVSLPDNALALVQQAESDSVLAIIDMQRYIARSLSETSEGELGVEDIVLPKYHKARLEALAQMEPTTRNGLAARFVAAAELLAQACAQAPTNGHYLALLGRALSRARGLGAQVDDARMDAAYELAHKQYPNVGSITAICADGAWRKFLRANNNEARKDALANAFDLFKETMEQDPGQAYRIFRLLATVVENPDHLLSLSPDYLVCYESLYRFLFEQRQLSACLSVLDEMERRNAERPTLEEAYSGELFVLLRLDRREREEVLTRIRQRRALVRGLMEDWSGRDEAMEDIREVFRLTLQEKLQEIRTLIAEKDYYRASAQLKGLLDLEPTNPEAVLLAARVRRAMSDVDGANEYLLGLVYDESDLSRETIEEALELVSEPHSMRRPYGDDEPFPVWRFIGAVLKLKHGQADVAQEELLVLTRLMEKGEVARWLQRPLVYYYLGIAYEKLGNKTGALRAYANALTYCPHHLAAAQAATRLWEEVPLFAVFPDKKDDDLVKQLDDSRKWLMQVDIRVPVNVQFGGKAILKGFNVSPRRLPPGKNFDTTLYWLCTGDFRREYMIACNYFDGSRLAFSDAFDFSGPGRDMVTWRVGELITAKRRISPLKAAAQQGRGFVGMGQYDLQVYPYASGVSAHALKSLVEARGPAFIIVEKADD